MNMGVAGFQDKRCSSFLTQVYPGATHVVAGGRTILLTSNQAQREAVAKQLIATADVNESNQLQMGPKVVLRHIEARIVLECVYFVHSDYFLLIVPIANC